MSNFSNPVTTLTGQTVNLENYALDNLVFWHIFWGVFGVAWILYWVRRPVFIPRFLLVDAGRADELVSNLDKKVGAAFFAVTVLVVIFSYAAANSKYPITIPLQAGTVRGIKAIDEKKPTVSVKVEDATYRVPGRAMRMKLTISNHGATAIRLGEFYTASVRFMDSSVIRDETGYPEDLLAEDGLTVSDNSPLPPGETRTVEVTASDAAWEVYRLSDIIYDPDSRFAGLLFFWDTNGVRQVTQIDAPLIPSFI
jgi:methane/ammonia monooxygenase subunit B